MGRPELLIEQWLPTKELGIESRRESAPIPGQFPRLKTLHVWWARRPLVASAGAVLASLLPVWTFELRDRYPGQVDLATEKAYQRWFLRLCGILGDPVRADLLTRAAKASGERIPNPYTYKQAFKNSPNVDDLSLLHRVLEATWGRLPEMADPTAGGGSIPFEAIRYGLPAHANDLNAIAAAVLRAGVEIPARFGSSLLTDLEIWGREICTRMQSRLEEFFPNGPGGKAATFLFARTVACPRTGKQVPLAPNWWLSKEKGGVGVKLVTHRSGVELDEPEFDIVKGRSIDKRVTDAGTIARGDAVSPWDQLVIDSDYIKTEAKAGRMGSILYAVAVRTSAGRGFRSPTPTDLNALRLAEDELARRRAAWEVDDIIPDEELPRGNDMRPLEYGMPRWRDMFSPRQLLVHGTFVEEYRKLIPEVREAVRDQDRADAVLALLGMAIGKGVNYNSRSAFWDYTRQKTAHTFSRHDFAFRWNFAEFEGAVELYTWSIDQVLDAYEGIASLMTPAPAGGLVRETLRYPTPGRVVVTQHNAGDLAMMSTGSVELVCIDPPYYDNVMYAELADFFYVWEKRTVGRLWPDLFADALTNKDEEAVANPARFEHAGRRKKELATLDYERKMTAIFAECRRILTDGGVMTVMFTHKKAEAWDTLGQSLLEAGFTIEASWPVPTESEQSLHQAQKNAAASTIFLVCRKRLGDGVADKVFFDSIESDVRHAARQAYSRFTEAGLDGVDRLLATYGPALSVLSEHWPVYSSEPDESGGSRLLRPDEALLTAQEEVVRLQRSRLIPFREEEFDPITDYWLLAWDTFRAREFPFDEARKLAMSIGGVEVDELNRAKFLVKKSGFVSLLQPKQRLRRDADSDLPGVHRDRDVFPVLIDALHTAMYVLDMDGAAAARIWLDRRRLTTDGRFRALLEGAVRAVPRTRDKDGLILEEAVLLERLLVAAFPEIEIPEDEVTLLQGQQALDV